MEDRTKRIDLYLNDGLSKADRLAFEALMEKDESLRKELELQQKTSELLEAAAWLKTKEKVFAINDSSTTSSKLWLKVAAVFIGVLLTSYLVLNYTYGDKQLYAKYSSPYPDRITSMGTTGDDLTQAMTFYNQAAYGKALSLFKTIREKGEANQQLILYEAIALTEEDRAEEALSLLELTPKVEPNLQAAFVWQKVMSYLANEEGDEAYETLQVYLEAKHQYQRSKALQLKEDLESSWR